MAAVRQPMRTQYEKEREPRRGAIATFWTVALLTGVSWYASEWLRGRR